MVKELPHEAFKDYCKICKQHHTSSICPKDLPNPLLQHRRPDIVQAATIEGQDGVVWHLEYMEIHKDYKILINGEKYLARISDKEHLWIRKDYF